MKLPRWYLIICHFAVPLIFAWGIKMQRCDPLFLQWEVVVLLTGVSLPFLLPLLALYIKGIGKEGVIFNDVVSKSVSAETVRGIELTFADKRPTRQALPQISDLGVRARKVLRTLWYFQRQQFGEAQDKRWGFGIHPSAPDYVEFRAGATELLTSGLIAEDRRGLVFLSDSGMEFCKQHENELGDRNDMWTTFGPA